MELIAVNDYPSKFSIYTEASDLDENDFCIDQENIFTLTIDEASTDVHVKLSLADAVVLLSNAHPRKFPDSDRVFDYLCAACGVSQEHGRPRSNMLCLTVGDVPRLLGQIYFGHCMCAACTLISGCLRCFAPPVLCHMFFI